ncbi:hypothetical protein BV20DRAFT_1088595 [Pilatotrama ljubarskyi]|nr:hypothetical protein BV20DRAFT_1088595 [Pilatotrama ljubarskyi]
MPQMKVDPALHLHQIEDGGTRIPAAAVPAGLGVPASVGLGAYNVLIALTENTSEVYGHSPKDSQSRYARLAKEARYFAAGPMCPRAFLETFCPCPAEVLEKMPSAVDAFKDVWIDALNHKEGTVSRCPGYTFCDTSQNPDTSGSFLVKPDITCYFNEHLPLVAVEKDDTLSHANMGFAALFFEVKNHSDKDYFQDLYAHLGSSCGRCLLVPALTYDKARGAQLKVQEYFGQHVTYATEVQARQFRLWCFSVSVAGRHIRLMRWDRAGVIVSRHVDLHHEPDILCQFLWRFAHMSEAQRGLDLTMEPSTDAEEALFRNAIKKHAMVQLGLCQGEHLDDAVQEHYQPKAVSAVQVFFYQRRCPWRTEIPCVMSPGNSAVCHWTRDSDILGCRREVIDKEGEVIAALHRSEQGLAPNVLQVLCHGDMASVLATSHLHLSTQEAQVTKTQDFIDALWACDQGIEAVTFVKRSHYRLVLSVAGYSLQRLSRTSELLTGGYHAYQAMLHANRMGRLHRDISVGNIVLFHTWEGISERTGYLLNWDLSWNDDMEPLLYVLLFCAFHWLGHSLDPDELLSRLESMFNFSQYFRGKPSGGLAKRTNVTTRQYTGDVQFESKALHKWPNRMMDFHAASINGGMVLQPVSPAYIWMLPEKIDEWWQHLLISEELGTNDRVPRKIRYAALHKHESREVGEADSPKGNTATMPSLRQPKCKHSADEDEADTVASNSAPPGKRLKLMDDLTTTYGAPTPVTYNPMDGLKAILLDAAGDGVETGPHVLISKSAYDAQCIPGFRHSRLYGKHLHGLAHCHAHSNVFHALVHAPSTSRFSSLMTSCSKSLALPLLLDKKLSAFELRAIFLDLLRSMPT